MTRVGTVKTMAEAWAARGDDDHPGLRFGQQEWTWRAVVDEARRRAVWWTSLRRPGPPHVALLLDNIPEHVFWLGACALSGAVAVGLNPTHRGAVIAGELAHTRCQLLVTDTAHLELVEGLDLGPGIGMASDSNQRIVLVGGEARPTLGDGQGAGVDGQGAGVDGTPADPGGTPQPDSSSVSPDALGYLIFTSGTSGAPKACRCTQGRMASIGAVLAQAFHLGPDDGCYLSMPLFHSNALMAGWAPDLVGGATMALPTGGRFSASGFLPDVRRHHVTYCNYVGRPLSYVLATPERPDDAENPLRIVFGNEAAPGDVERLARRFGCAVFENYGSTEGGVSVSRTPDTPPGALGPAPPDVLVVGPDGGPCPPARFDEHGRLANAEEAIGEMVSTKGAAGFEGYWENDEASSDRVRDGWYWTGDLVYRDERGYLWFAGRADDWLRVDGENFAAAPVARILERHPDVVMAAVYAVPDPSVGDQVMAALQLRPGAAFDPAGFGRFVAAQPDLGTKWVPRYVRVSEALPTTATAKILVRQLRAAGVDCDDPVWENATGDPLAYTPR